VESVARAGGSGSSGPAAPLTTPAIVEAALRVAQDKGFASLTMRALAEELGVSAMAAYHYVPNKQALIELVVDAVLELVEVPPTEFGQWGERLRELQRRNAAVLAAHPGIEPLLYSMPPTGQGRRIMDGYVEILRDAGFSRADALQALSVVHAYGLGRSAMERRSGPETASGHDESADPWTTLRARDSREFGIVVIIEGLRVLLAAHSQPDDQA
jgi:AcrR family transcriptional regulator